MKLSDLRNRLQAPFSAHLVHWKPGALSRNKDRALLMAFIDARAVQDRLDAVCPDDWHFDAQEVPSAKVPTVRGTLTVLGVSRTDFGEGDPTTGAGDSYKAACSDALKRCAVQFGIGRYLYDLPRTWVEWDEQKRAPRTTPELPVWARPEHERGPGGTHLTQALEQLRQELPEDLELQRTVYKHLVAALGALHHSGREAESEGDPVAPTTSEAPISKATKQRLAQHVTRRWNLERTERLAFVSWLAEREEVLASTEQLTEAEGQRVLARLTAPDSAELMARYGGVEAVA
ncbi:hypothetical protein SAMN04488058_101334 [Deinococcus reticulitermitis]|uniref:Rad52/22 family double-strand break repair protein n=1 Tax=Deinococcus reticulitermitis TaxID=856736 RepID=A0A1H6SN75_9DEIO|nr:hypothetical protein SAMN04488058_101334 [Deinococcus reticulitermitis]